MDRPVPPEEPKRTLPDDSAVALVCARSHVPDQRVERDALIIAATIVYGMTAVTAAVVDFEATRVDLISHWNET